MRTALIFSVFAILSIQTAMSGGPGPHHDRSKDRRYPAGGPFYSGNFSSGSTSRVNSDGKIELKFVSYNINMSQELPKVIQDLQNLMELKNADFINLQEAIGSFGGVTGNTVESIAKALKMNYVFAPGSVLYGNDYGNAILSRWPLSAFRKTLLPHSDGVNQRIALGTTANVDGKLIQIYSIHLSVVFKDTLGSDRSRELQVATALNSIDLIPSLPVFISGDFNSVNPYGWMQIAGLFGEKNYSAVPDLGWTFKTRHFVLDHAFMRGMQLKTNGIAYSALGSDHVPIWSEVLLLP